MTGRLRDPAGQSTGGGSSRLPQSRHRRADGTVAVVAVGSWTARIRLRHSGQNMGVLLGATDTRAHSCRTFPVDDRSLLLEYQRTVLEGPRGPT
jgi:hypothetical protein